jgi:large subunit ribosomal protein L25
MEEFVLIGEAREGLGTRAATLLRKEGKLPVNIYGHKQASANLQVDYREFEKFFGQGHRILAIDVGGKKEHGVIREVQYNTYGTQILHVDLARVDLMERISLSVPIEAIGQAKGQAAGGTLDFNLNDVQVAGPASSIPAKIEVKIKDLDTGDDIRIKDLELPSDCNFEHDDNDIVLAVHAPRGEEDTAEPVEGEDADMPEVIAKKEGEEGGGEG